MITNSEGSLLFKKQSIITNQEEDASALAELLKILESVEETEEPFAKLNLSSISDNNGGRIEL